MTVPERLSALRKCMEEKNKNAGKGNRYLYYSDCRFSSERICWGTFQSEKVHYRVLWISGNGRDHKDRSKTLDRRTLLHPGSSTVEGDNCRTYENG